MTRQALASLASTSAAGVLAGCQLLGPAPAPLPPPVDACNAMNESLAAAVPPGESLAELQARGIRLRTPLRLLPGSAPSGAQSGGAAVQVMIAPDGSVVPGSPKTLKSVGEPQVARAIEAAALSMSFELDPGTRPAAPVPHTTVLAVCQRS
jgi:hypothetical protein